ncbi:hypothetical protein [Streptomyces fragilis]|uniref:Uncharacterized protein n=1 Tax=Streptomyces fragilis TaxID=67301 RepID=A0ABV2YB75_9ACTN|nr:hypothetical protein [Streptomyces fragilis]
MRELPWQTDDGKPAFTPYGNGRLHALADAHEETLLAVAREDAIRARELVRDPATTSGELSLAVRALVHAVRSAAHVADLRGHRLHDLALQSTFREDNEE